MASFSFPALPPAAPSPVAAPVVPTAAPALPVGAVEAIVPVALLQADIDGFPLPAAQPAPGLAAPGAAPDGAAMRPDQVAMARQLHWPAPDAGALAGAWRGMVRSYGSQLVAREIQSRPGQLPTALLQTGQDAQLLRQAGLDGPPFDAWRFTVHAGGPREQHLRVIGEQEQQKGGRQRRRRTALRLELVLADGSIVTVQAEPLADGVMLELCASDAHAAAHLRTLQPQLETAVWRSGLRVLGWTWRDTLPPAPAHARLPSTEAAHALSLPVFRAMAEMALVLPAD
ncbi:hypothetical protein [uncultured Massilia sp.]|uniref:hypothetical protein n=1 Tax=uncultured Massilia sp. TaxID=169973 RepID=UPI0025FCC403|nr:hypothetical protein [uncultured Massilia sp.]